MGPLILSPVADWRRAYRLVNMLLHAGCRVSWTTAPFTAGGMSCPQGTFLLPEFDAGPLPAQAVRKLAEMHEVPLIDPGAVPVPPAADLRAARVAIYGGGGAPYHHAGALGELGFDFQFLHEEHIRAGGLAAVDALIVPGGGWRTSAGQLEPLGPEGARAIRDFVLAGGLYAGSCAGSRLGAITAALPSSCVFQEEMRLVNARVWNERDGQALSPGIGVIWVQNTAPEDPVMFGMPAEFALAHYNGPLFELVDPVLAESSPARGLCRVAGVTPAWTPAESFLRPVQGPEEDPGRVPLACMDPPPGTLLGAAAKAGVYAAVGGRLGRGYALLVGSHPEFGFEPVLDRWQLPMRMVANAVLWSAGRGGRPSPAAAPPGSGEAHDPELLCRRLATGLAGVEDSLRRLGALTRGQQELPAWAGSSHALSMYGLGPGTIWRHGLQGLERMVREFAEELERLPAAVARGREFLPGGDAARLSDLFHRACSGFQAASVYRRGGPPVQDLGYQGIEWLLEHAAGQLRRAIEHWDIELGEPDGSPGSLPGAYRHVLDNPYHLVAGSYLAATGILGGALLLTRAHRHRVELAADLLQVFAESRGRTEG